MLVNRTIGPSREPAAETLQRAPGPVDPVDPPLPMGSLVGSYVLCGWLGGGTSCQVYVAEHLQLARRVALKILRPAFACYPRLVQRFVREAQAVNRVSNRHVVEVTDIGNAAIGPYIVMELLEGEALDASIARGPLPRERCLAIARQVAEGMQAAHAAGIVHRDLKPGNIFLDRHDGDELVKVLDFGIAKVAEPLATLGAASTGTETLPGTILGSPAYMSPEQVLAQAVDHRSDIYALGVVLYEMCSGRRPFTGATLRDVLGGHVWHPPRPLGETADVDAELEALVMRCLAKKPEDRPESMAEVHEALARLAAAGPRPTDEAAPPVAAEAAPPVAVETAPPVEVEPPVPPTISTGRLVHGDRRWTYALALLLLVGFAGLSYALSAKRTAPVRSRTATGPVPTTAASAGPPAPERDRTRRPAAPTRPAATPTRRALPAPPTAPSKAPAALKRPRRTASSRVSEHRADRRPAAGGTPAAPGPARVTPSTTIDPFATGPTAGQ